MDFVKDFNGPRTLGNLSVEIKEVDIKRITELLQYTITASNGGHWPLSQTSAFTDKFLRALTTLAVADVCLQQAQQPPKEKPKKTAKP